MANPCKGKYGYKPMRIQSENKQNCLKLGKMWVTKSRAIDFQFCIGLVDGVATVFQCEENQSQCSTVFSVRFGGCCFKPCCNLHLDFWGLSNTHKLSVFVWGFENEEGSFCHFPVLMPLHFRYVNPRFDFRWVDSSTTVAESSHIGCIGHVLDFFQIAVSRQIQDHVLLYLIASTTTKSPRDAKSLSTVDALETETTSPLRRSVRKLAGMYCARDGIAEQI